MKKRNVTPPGERRKPFEVLRAYTTDYPSKAPGAKTILLKAIPADTFKLAAERALVTRRSIRWVVIRLLEKFGKGEIEL